MKTFDSLFTFYQIFSGNFQAGKEGHEIQTLKESSLFHMITDYKHLKRNQHNNFKF